MSELKYTAKNIFCDVMIAGSCVIGWFIETGQCLVDDICESWEYGTLKEGLLLAILAFIFLFVMCV